ncbi:hypothetical protein [Photorhabdus temperata]|uniref:hypothetical protein n=1 Tax=Photorhabdus temperata TaxID=574560 RepID=UPI001FB09123|nr:hypothetical protein [Photorhabdus temperata]
MLLIDTLGEPRVISPQGLRDEAPAETQASRAISPKYPVAMLTAMAAPISKTPTPRQDAANPATKRAPDRIPPAAEINEPMTVPAINPAMALEWPIVSPTRAASGIAPLPRSGNFSGSHPATAVEHR